MARLEELAKGAVVRGVIGDRRIRVVDVSWHGSAAVTLTYTDEATGRPDQELLYRDDEPRLTVETADRAWSMDGDGRTFRLASEAKRISLAHLFDQFLAVQTSNLDPLPHQVDAVYNRMLPQQPLRFLLADDPGAGKTIMAGLLCKELMTRGDVERCLVIAPGSLVEQWQDELWEKFALDFKILSRDMIEAARSGNPFAEQPLLIARLDHLARNEDLQERLRATDWDLTIVDEAHKMAAHYSGGEIRETRRYRLGRLAGSVSRHLLLMTATPHAGIEVDFRLFLALLDSDRFEGAPRDKTPYDPGAVDLSDVMRRLVKEKLLTFDGKPLFPERRAYTAVYPLSDAETLLYKRVTGYVREEMNRADRMRTEGEGSRGAIVGFALTTLQRRLASSPEAIHQSLRRRRQRLEKRASELRISPALNAYRREVFASNFMGMRRAAFAPGTVDGSAKLRRLVEIAGEAAEGGRKVVVFSYFRDVLAAITRAVSAEMPGAWVVGPLTGSVAPPARQAMVDEFTASSGPAVLVAQIQAGGVGLNIQAASVVIMAEPQLTPAIEEQAIARAHRMGQVRRVDVHRLLCENSVDQRMLELLHGKRVAFDEYARRSDLADATPDAMDVSDLTAAGHAATEAELQRRIVEAEQKRLRVG